MQLDSFDMKSKVKKPSIPNSKEEALSSFPRISNEELNLFTPVPMPILTGFAIP